MLNFQRICVIKIREKSHQNLGSVAWLRIRIRMSTVEQAGCLSLCILPLLCLGYCSENPPAGGKNALSERAGISTHSHIQILDLKYCAFLSILHFLHILSYSFYSSKLLSKKFDLIGSNLLNYCLFTFFIN